MVSEIPIDQFQDFPVSNMAKNRASRYVQEALDTTDFSERIAELIMRANNGMDIADGYDGDVMDLFSPAFRHGIRVAVRTLAAAGLSEGETPTEGLIDRALQTNLVSSLILEQTYIGDIKKLYLPIDGGNGE